MPFKKVANKEKKVNKDDEAKKAKKVRKASTLQWGLYIKRVFNKIEGEDQNDQESSLRIKSHSVGVLNSLVNDIIDRIGFEASNLCKITRSKRLNIRDLSCAISLVHHHTDVARIMNEGGMKALKDYDASNSSER